MTKARYVVVGDGRLVKALPGVEVRRPAPVTTAQLAGQGMFLVCLGDGEWTNAPGRVARKYMSMTGRGRKRNASTWNDASFHAWWWRKKRREA